MAIHRGAEGRRRVDEELARQKQRSEARKKQGNVPFRFYVPVGETREIIVVDEAPEVFVYEHNLPGPDKKYRTYTPCIKEDQNCPVCESQDKESYYALMLTVIDLTPFETRSGDEVQFSRKLMCVKIGQQKKFLRFFQKNGSLRGAKFAMTRDGEKDAAIGNDIEFLEFVEEEDLQTYTREWEDKDRKVHTENCFEVLDYDELFPEVTEEELRALVGGRPAPGSRAHDDAAVGRDSKGRDASRGRRTRGRPGARDADADSDWENDDDKRSFGKDKERAPAGRAAARPAARRGRDEADDDADDRREYRDRTRPARGRDVDADADTDTDTDADDAPDTDTRRPASRTRPAAGKSQPRRDDSQRVRRRTTEPDDVEPDADDPDDADLPPRRTAAKPAARTSTRAAPASTRRAARDEPDDADADDDLPFDPDPPRRTARASREAEPETRRGGNIDKRATRARR